MNEYPAYLILEEDDEASAWDIVAIDEQPCEPERAGDKPVRMRLLNGSGVEIAAGTALDERSYKPVRKMLALAAIRHSIGSGNMVRRHIVEIAASD